MTLRVLYICEGSSDTGLKLHIEEIAAEAGYELLVTVPNFDRLRESTGRAVADKLRVARRLDDAHYDIALIHRDADNVQPLHRCQEISAAVTQEWPGLAHVPIIPVRMLEAWLLVDETAIREVSGNPNGRAVLNLPKPAKVETESDPKQRLKDAIATASGVKGRELKKLQARFPQNRRRLLQMLDRKGPIRRLTSWQAFVADLQRALEKASSK
ncbi:DUF4276 family protein [Embleya hyalina]|uniref:DUF4276 family protein n=1 Tax=Embleya hyalina TaxID=516124 RepID=A0A401YWI2_9ACTN|nr:DUF4276 family protein [Embleya hyalina]GCD98968.1 hypothetical protein EHYA_06680 [Embleya hyalina]